MGGDDVLDRGTVLGFLQAQRVDQDALIGDRGRDALEFGQLAAGAGQLLEDGGRLEAGWGERWSGRIRLIVCQLRVGMFKNRTFLYTIYMTRISTGHLLYT